MRIELNNVLVELRGDGNSIAEATLTALAGNGAIVDTGRVARLPDILIVSLPLVAGAELDAAPLLKVARTTAEAMFARAHGRIVFLVSAAAGLPMRRHPDYSVQMAGVLAAMRGLAMEFGPHVLVNALGVGLIGEPAVAGDAAMLAHASVGRPGSIEEAVAGVLFFCDPANTYTTGQLLSVDGGWSVGYGRNF